MLRSLLGYWKEETYLKFLYQAWESSLAEPHSPQARFPTLCYFLAESCSASTPAQVLTPDPCYTWAERAGKVIWKMCNPKLFCLRDRAHPLLDMKDSLGTREWSH